MTRNPVKQVFMRCNFCRQEGGPYLDAIDGLKFSRAHVCPDAVYVRPQFDMIVLENQLPLIDDAATNKLPTWPDNG